MGAWTGKFPVRPDPVIASAAVMDLDQHRVATSGCRMTAISRTGTLCCEGVLDDANR